MILRLLILMLFVVYGVFLFWTAVRPGFGTDVGTFWSWAVRVNQIPWTKVYAPDYFLDYPPLVLYLFYPIGWLINFFGINYGSPLGNIIVKLPGLVSLLAVSGCFLRCGRQWNEARHLSPAVFLMSSLFFLFNPALVYNAAVWGQVDAFYIFCAVLAIWAAWESHVVIMWLCMGLLFAFKPQAVFMLPFIFFFFVLTINRRTAGFWLVGILIAALVLPLTMLPFWWGRIPAGFAHYGEMFNRYPYATVNGFNLFMSLGYNWAEAHRQFLGPITFYQLGMFICLFLSTVSTFLVVFVRLRQKQSTAPTVNPAVLACYLGFAMALGLFLFAPSMHERYVVCAFPFLFFLGLRHRSMFLATIVLSLVVGADQAYVLDMADVSKTSITSTSAYAFFSFGAKLLVFLLAAWEIYRLIFRPAASLLPHRPWVPLDLQVFADITRKARAPFVMDARAWGTVAIGFLVALAINLYRLGDGRIPLAAFEQSQELVLHFAPTDTIAQAWVFDGRGEGSVSFSCQETPQELQTIELRSYYDWRNLGLKKSCPIVVLKTQLNTEAQIHEMFFRTTDLRSVIPEKVCLQDLCVSAAEHPLFNEFNPQLAYPGYLQSTYFDEVYYPRAVNEILDSKPILEQTHPPLGKVMITAAVRWFGRAPFWWRLPGALLGALIPVLLYFLARTLFAKRSVATLAMLFSLTDNARVSLSRICTIDVQTCFWMLLCCWTAFSWYRAPQGSSRQRWYGALLGVFAGLSIATKWNGVFCVAAIVAAMGIYLLALIREKKTPIPFFDIALLFLCLTIIPISIYAASYIPIIISQHSSWRYILENQQYILNYHSSVTDQHPFASRYMTWPTMERPVWFFIAAGMPAGWKSSIVMIGNPLIWWSSIPLIFWALFYRRWRYELPVLLVVVLSLAVYLPWFSIKRVCFLYHYYPLMCFSVLLFAKFVAELDNKILRFAAIGSVVILFILFLPVTMGLPIQDDYVERLRWFATWIF